MHSPHFDAIAYQSHTYRPTSGVESNTYKLHHLGSVEEDPDADGYPNYATQCMSTAQDYGFLDTQTYADDPSIYPSVCVLSSLGNAGCYKMHCRQMDLVNYTCPSVRPRQQITPFMTSLEPIALSVSPNEYNVTNINSHNEHSQHHHHHEQQPQHHHHQQQLLHNHHHHQTSYDLTPCNIETSIQDDSAILCPNFIKTESLSSELFLASRNVRKSPNATTNTPSTHFRNKYKSTTRNPPMTSTSCENISSSISSNLTEIKSEDVPSENSPESSPTKMSTDFKRSEETISETKPTMSYIGLIAKAILESEHRRLSLGSIYNWIEKYYPFYKSKGQGWRNSVRHNLSLNDCFIKAGRCEDGKGNYWAIHPANLQDFVRGDFRQRRRSRRRGKKRDCDLNMFQVPTGYLQSPNMHVSSGMALYPSSLGSTYSAYTEAERRAYQLDEALFRQRMGSPFVKWYQQGVTNPGYAVSTSPPVCSTGVYPSSPSGQWPQPYAETNNQLIYPALGSAFPR